MKLKKGDLVYALNVRSFSGITFECIEGFVVSLDCIKKTITIRAKNIILLNTVTKGDETLFYLSLDVFKIYKDRSQVKSMRKTCLDLSLLLGEKPR